MARLRAVFWFAVLALPALISHAATPILRDWAVPGPSAGFTEVAPGPLGAVWFTQFDANRIGMLSYDGEYREFAVPTPDSGPRGIVGDSFAVWFTEFKAGKIGKLSPDGTFKEYLIPTPQSGPWGIALAVGQPWFTESAGNKIGRLNADGSITEFAIPTPNAVPRGIGDAHISGACFAEFAADQIGCLENGQIRERRVSPGSGPEGISNLSNDAKMWFTETTGNRVGRIDFNRANGFADARIEEFPVPTPVSGLASIVTDSPNSGAWFAEKSAGQIGFISGSFRFTEYALPDRSSQPTGITLSFLGAVFLEAAKNRVVEIQHDAVVLAGGTSGRWLTETQVANPLPRSMWVFAGRFPRPAEVCAGSCPPAAGVQLQANGSGRLDINNVAYGLLTYFVRNLDEGDLPSVRARIYNRDFPGQSADIPMIRLSTLTSLNPRTLVFPGALKNGSARSNLLIVDASVDRLVIGPVRTTRVLVEVLDAGGTPLGSGEFSFLGGNNLYLVDIIGRLGVTTLQDGQIRVSKIGDEGLLWGYLVTVNSEGAVSIFSGLNP